jgi:hypothetical protein
MPPWLSVGGRVLGTVTTVDPFGVLSPEVRRAMRRAQRVGAVEAAAWARGRTFDGSGRARASEEVERRTRRVADRARRLMGSPFWGATPAAGRRGERLLIPSSEMRAYDWTPVRAKRLSRRGPVPELASYGPFGPQGSPYSSRHWQM